MQITTENKENPNGLLASYCFSKKKKEKKKKKDSC